MKKKIVIFLIVGFVAFGLWHWYRSWNAQREMDAYLHRKIESKFVLNESQKVGMPAADPNGVRVIRFKDAAGTWQTALHQAPEGAKEEMILGILHSSPVGSTVSVPVYFCSYPTGFPNPTSSLDLAANCSGGKNILGHPAGYVSREIREGYFLLFHCRNSKSGLYLTLNSRCESAEDGIQDSLGAIRAVSN